MTRIHVPIESSAYHVVSRTAQQQFYFGEEERETFRRMMWRVAKFCGVEIFTYAVLDNHFHILIKVPRKDHADEALSWAEFFTRYEVLYGKARGRDLLALLKECKGREAQEKFQAQIMSQHISMMHSLPVFMRLLKQRFGKWYNKKHKKSGTLWDQRYRSVLVEERTDGPSHALLAVAAYIDLNSVRAGVVQDPKDYRHSGYGEAVGGQMRARHGLMRVVGRTASNWAEAQAGYRKFLYRAGQVRLVKRGRLQGNISEAEAEVVEKNRGKLSLAEALHSRIRYFTRGGILGSKEFVDRVFEANRELFGKRRKVGARKMGGGIDWGEMVSLRKLGQ
jgi:putative transposase